MHRIRGRKALVAALAGSAAATTALSFAPVATAATPEAAPTKSRAIADKMIKSDAQFECFSHIVERESSWDHTAQNASSGAYGLVQALPATKMATAGSDWRTNPKTQIEWGLDYMKERYGSACDAWSFWQANNWY
ncbi:transglycosylase SLT domain-containing protein [Streptomyces phytophilus]|uniref:aggregation-promoting factor C-terminal-like domain-containing protein n=1 Tax=Streptomyces phytophilus TaxID=722715 RepID=UPI0015F0F2A0|nr:transglycosylase SLT domain-containing protein [Streptomyces phytophilus]